MRLRFHMSVNLEGLLRTHRRKSLKGFFLDNSGRELSDKECRAYIAECQSKGWKYIPMGKEEDCPNFDHLREGCPGHIINE